MLVGKLLMFFKALIFIMMIMMIIDKSMLIRIFSPLLAIQVFFWCQA